ncbi:MAG TPA: DUF167 domain-containing protein [Candidatus Paceibacterota bacterium]|nr:DUF167 domain-containing protein [Candidatus Paceibacterota bacterium]
MYIHVRVKTGEKRERVLAIDERHFAIAVKEPAEQNLANARVKALVAKELRVPEAAVRMIKGHRSPSKIFDVKGRE